MRKLCAVVTCLLLYFTNAAAVEVSFPAPTVDGYPAVGQVSANLELPPGTARGRLPAVVILHGSGGIDERGAFYAKTLIEAGIATLEIFMFPRGGRPKTLRETFPHMYGGLNYLAGRPDIDPGRIGVTGFSWGGGLTLFAASGSLTERFMGGRLRFAAHAPLYPGCSAQLRMTSDPNSRAYGAYRTLTDKPVLILTGGKDDYDEPDSCQRFIAALPGPARTHVSLKYYAKATHGWDTQEPSKNFYDEFARQGRGGYVQMTADREIAQDSRRTVTDFFVRHLSSR